MVSVVIPCYEAADDVAEAIQSVLRQTYDECIKGVVVVDDGSTDQSEAVIRRWEAKDERVQYIYQENHGPSVARNRGVAEASGEYVAFLDADDLWLPEKLEHQMGFHENHPEVALLCSDYFVEGEGPQWRMRARHLDYRQDDALESLYLRGGPVMMSTVVVRKDVFESVGGFDPSILKGQDADLWLRIAARHPIHHVPEALVVKRTRAGSVSEDVPRKVKFLREITDRLADRYSRLEPIRQQRHGILHEMMARYWLEQGSRRRAAKHAYRALTCYPTSLKALLLTILTILPFPTERLRDILHGLGKLRRSLAGVKTAISRTLE